MSVISTVDNTIILYITNKKFEKNKNSLKITPIDLANISLMSITK